MDKGEEGVRSTVTSAVVDTGRRIFNLRSLKRRPLVAQSGHSRPTLSMSAVGSEADLPGSRARVR